ncbi:MAG: hypothetical protein ACXWPM_06970 [Bdellovibrionota bacterium]
MRSRSFGERGQATTEYVLLLAILLALFLGVMNKSIKPMFKALSTSIQRNFEKGLQGDLHQCPMCR